MHVAKKFDAVNHDVSTQLKGLLFGPWLQCEATRRPELRPYLIVIDALDEIKDDEGSAFLQELLVAIDQYDFRGIKFLVTSRSDPKVAELCESFKSKAVCRLQDVPIKAADLDIRTYLETKLPNLANSQQLAQLGRRAGGLFIYAATAVKYLTPHRSITTREQTKLLGNLLSSSSESTSASEATLLIDELYKHIMRDTFSKYKEQLLTDRLCILYTFLCTAERTSMSVVTALVPRSEEHTSELQSP